MKLEPVLVYGDRRQDDDSRADRSTAATRTNTPLLDIPQSVSVVTSGQILDQQMTSLGDVVRYVPGVGPHQGENNRDQIVFRGNSSSADFFLNGVRDDVQYFRDLYNLDRVEILRGPNAMIFGRGGGGGVINRVTKEAGFSPLREITLHGGSFGRERATLDVDEPLTSRVAIRINAVDEDSGSFRDFVDLKRQGLNPTLTVLFGPQIKITLGCGYLHDTRTADRGITSFQGLPADVPIETYYGDPADSRVHANVNLVSAAVESRVGALRISNRTFLGDYDRGYQNFVPGAVTADKGLVALSAYNNATRRKNIFNQTDLTGTVTTGQIRHTLLGGVEWGRQVTDNFRNTGYFNNTATSISVPFDDPTISTPVTWRQSATDADNHLKTDLAAIYAQDQIEFTQRWQAIVGLRFDSFHLRYHNNRTGDDLGRRDGLVSPRAGLVFKPRTQVSVYASYSVSHLPSSGDQFSSLTNVSQQVNPEKFTNYEVGAKWDAGGHVSLTMAIYRLDRTNTRATDPNDPTRILQTGSQRTNGVELSLNGRLTPRWTATAGYACQNAFIVSATTSARAGATVAQVPRQALSLWNKYQVSGNLSVGLGVVRRSDMFAAIDNAVTLPGYTEMDAAVYYMFGGRWRLQVNAENLLNKRYFVDADSNTNISPGSPFAVGVGLAVRF